MDGCLIQLTNFDETFFPLIELCFSFLKQG